MGAWDGSGPVCPRCRQPLKRTTLSTSNRMVQISCTGCRQVWLEDLNDPTAKLILVQGSSDFGTPQLSPARMKPSASHEAYRALVRTADGRAGSWFEIAACTVLVALDHFDRHMQRRRSLDIATAFVKTAHGDINVGPRERFLEVYRWFEEHANK